MPDASQPQSAPASESPPPEPAASNEEEEPATPPPTPPKKGRAQEPKEKVGQALASANLCGQCGEALEYSVKTGLPCPPRSADGHYHEKMPVYGGGVIPVCCKCLRANGEECGELRLEKEAKKK